MDRSTPITLIAQKQVQDKNGVWRTSETSRVVFANVKSASATEFFEGGRNGLNPSFVFTMFRYDYQDEPVVEYEGKRYAVYRVYLNPLYRSRANRNDYIELHVERKGGTNGGT